MICTAITLPAKAAGKVTGERPHPSTRVYFGKLPSRMENSHRPRGRQSPYLLFLPLTSVLQKTSQRKSDSPVSSIAFLSLTHLSDYSCSMPQITDETETKRNFCRQWFSEKSVFSQLETRSKSRLHFP